jgi:hypothetical protein
LASGEIIMARVFNEAAWKSDKVFSIQPVEWRAEYAWLYSIALADGTFEASSRLVWLAAYASVRPDWDQDKVARLLDELERVGLLQRASAEDGKVWGRWVGSEKFLMSEERCLKLRLKMGRRGIFLTASEQLRSPATEELSSSVGAATQQLRVERGVGVGVERERERGVEAAKDSKNDQPDKNPKAGSVDSLGLEATPLTPQKQRHKPLLSREEYGEQKTARAVAELAAEVTGRPRCPVCQIPHELPFCKKPLEKP